MPNPPRIRHFKTLKFQDSERYLTLLLKMTESSNNFQAVMAAIVTVFLPNLISLLSQTFFDDLWTKFETYQAGEDLFGMPKTEYQELHKVKKELYMLQKLYSLYNSVNNSINGYYDILWSEVDIEKINNELQEFQSRWVTSFQHFG